MTKIFINYRTGDDPFVAVLLDTELRARFGSENVFRDSRSIELGADFRRKLWRSLDESDVLLVIIGARWLTVTENGQPKLFHQSDYVKREIARCLESDTLVIPILVGATNLPSAAELPPEITELAHRQYLRLHARTADYDIRHLIDELERVIDVGEYPPQEPVRTPPPAPEPVRGGITNNARTITVKGDMVGGDKKTVNHYHEPR